MSGYTKDELYHTMFTDLVHPEDRELVIRRNKERLSGKNFTPYDFRFRKKDNTYIWINLNATQIDWDGKPGVLCFASDISERKAAEEELRQNREDLKQLLNSAQDIIYLQDNQGNIELLNEYIHNILGYKDSKKHQLPGATTIHAS